MRAFQRGILQTDDDGGTGRLYGFVVPCRRLIGSRTTAASGDRRSRGTGAHASRMVTARAFGGHHAGSHVIHASSTSTAKASGRIRRAPRLVHERRDGASSRTARGSGYRRPRGRDRYRPAASDGRDGRGARNGRSCPGTDSDDLSHARAHRRSDSPSDTHTPPDIDAHARTSARSPDPVRLGLPGVDEQHRAHGSDRRVPGRNTDRVADGVG